MTASFKNIISTTIVAGIAAAAMGLGSAIAASPPAGMSEQEYRAEQIRSQALNDLYGAPEVTSAYKAMVRADRIRGEAMNRLARSGVFNAPVPVVTDTVAGDGFDWADFGIGLGAMLGLALLAGGLALGIHAARHPGARAHPHPAS
jgi:hypothetical protein